MIPSPPGSRRRSDFLLRIVTLAAACAAGVLEVAPAPSSASFFAGDTGSFALLPPPSTRHGHSTLYDPARDRLIVFGGQDGVRRDDTWAVNLAVEPEWERLLATGVAPTPRYGHTAVHDPVRDRMIVFGKDHDSADRVGILPLGGEPVWSQHSLPNGPHGALHEHSAIYDPVRDRVIVFGGVTYTGNPAAFTVTHYASVWALELADSLHWTLLTPAGTPPDARRGHTAVYDPVRDRMIVFGGTDGEPRRDVWALDLAGGTAWAPIVPDGGAPEPRHQHGAAYDPVHDAMIVFGGQGSDSLLSDVWTLSLAGTPQWSAAAPAGTGPSARFGHTVTWDPVRSRVVIVGGNDGHLKNDVWSLEVAGAYSWQRILLQGGPSRRTWPSIMYDPIRDRMLLFGGHKSDGTSNETRQYRFAADPPGWSSVTTTGTPPSPRYLHHAVYDPLRDRMLVFGGSQSNDLHALELANGGAAWTLVDPGTGPGSSWFAEGGFYDPRRDRVLFFGRTFSDAPDRTELWSYDLRFRRWDLVQPPGAGPTPDRMPEIVYDPVGDRLIAIGPTPDNSQVMVRQIRLSNDFTWFVLPTSGTPPPPRGRSTLIYDPVRHRVVVFGGSGALGVPSGQAWALGLSDATWHPLATLGVHLFNHPSIYDPVRDRMLSYQENETIVLAWGDPVRPSVACHDTVVLSKQRAQVGVYEVRNPAPDPRSITWTVSSARNWPGYPLHGHRVLAGGETASIEIVLPVPDSAAAGVGALEFVASFTGGEGNDVSCTQGVGDYYTSTLASLVSAAAVEGAIRIVWQVGDVSAFAIHRSTDGRTWNSLGERTPDGNGRIEWNDTGVIEGMRYAYRLTRAGAREPLLPNVWVTAGGIAELAFLGLRPNPTTGPISLALELPAARSVSVRVYDLAGRRVAGENRWLGAGSHLLALPSAGLEPGVYRVRVEAGERRFDSQFVLVR